MDYNYYHFGPFLFSCKIQESLLRFLEKSSKNLEKSYSDKLAGHLNNQYLFPEVVQKEFYKQFLEYISAYREAHCDYFNLNKNITVNISPTDLWINFMRPGEFNPLHVHGSDLSFVIFLDVPSEIQEEAKKFSGQSAPPGSLSFVYGQPARNDWMKTHRNFIPSTGDLFIFPSLLQHWVSPFKSDVTRISISGNLHYTNRKDWPKEYF